MDYNKILIALIVIFLVLVVALGVMFFNTSDSKTPTTIVATSNTTLNDGENFSIVLVDINGTPLSNQTVNITINDSNGKKSQHQIVTDERGNGVLQLNGSGEYTVNVTYGGNSKYSASNITQKIEIKEVVKQTSASSYNTGSAKSSKSSESPVLGVSASDYNEVLRLSHGDEDLAKTRAQSYHESGYI